VVATVRERLAVSKEAAQNFDVQRFNLKKQSELEVRKQYQLKISNRFAALENCNVREDINRSWEKIKENIKTSAKESLGLHEQKQHKPWFDEDCSQLLDKRKQAKIQCLQNPNQSNRDNVKNIRHKASRHFRNKKKEYLKPKISELETNSKNKNIRDLYRGINDFNKGYQPRTNVVNDKKHDLVANSHCILARWRNHFSQLLNIHGVNDVRQTELNTAEPLAPQPSASELEMAIEKLKRHKLPGTDQIPAKLIKAGGRIIRSEIHTLIISTWNKKELPEQWKESIIVPIYMKGEKTDCSNYHFCQLHTKFYPTFFCQC
jgi:hypothetical protein